jgi:glycosyltransferase involved in cell wall biosynthesis
LPSRTETFGTVVAEALACGLPVVCSRVGALPELVDAAVGRLVAPGDTDGLAHALSQTLAERGRRDNAAVSVAARARFGRNAIADRWTWVYAEAMAQRASR